MTTLGRVLNNVSEGVLGIMITGQNRFIINIDSIAVGKRVLEDNEKYKVICLNFESGKGLPNHSHDGEVSILVWDGKINIEFINGEKFTLNKGDFLSFYGGNEHNLVADGLTKVIVTIGK